MLDKDRVTKIVSVATAVPKYTINQTNAESLAGSIFCTSIGDFLRLAPVYSNAAI